MIRSKEILFTALSIILAEGNTPSARMSLS
jgi:hypothetical protein